MGQSIDQHLQIDSQKNVDHSGAIEQRDFASFGRAWL